MCLDGGPAPLIVMPFMVNGSLHAYLKKKRVNLLLDPDATKSDDAVIEVYVQDRMFWESIHSDVAGSCGKKVTGLLHSSC